MGCRPPNRLADDAPRFGGDCSFSWLRACLAKTSLFTQQGSRPETLTKSLNVGPILFIPVVLIGGCSVFSSGSDGFSLKGESRADRERPERNRLLWFPGSCGKHRLVDGWPVQ